MRSRVLRKLLHYGNTVYSKKKGTKEVRWVDQIWRSPELSPCTHTHVTKRKRGKRRAVWVAPDRGRLNTESYPVRVDLEGHGEELDMEKVVQTETEHRPSGEKRHGPKPKSVKCGSMTGVGTIARLKNKVEPDVYQNS